MTRREASQRGGKAVLALYGPEWFAALSAEGRSRAGRPRKPTYDELMAQQASPRWAVRFPKKGGNAISQA